MSTKIISIVNRGVIFSILITTVLFSQSWYLQNSNSAVQLKGIHMISQTTGWACGDAGTLLHTINAGTNWTSIVLTGSDLHQIVFKDEQTGVVVGDNGTVFTTTNSGLNWVSKNSATSDQLRGAAFAGGTTFYAVGDDGAAIKSTDDGNTWVALTSGTTERLLCVTGVGNNVWIGGRDGLMIYSNNGGSSFNQMTNPANDDIKDIQFINDQIGFADGSNSAFMFTSNGGVNWDLRSAGIQVGLNGLHFVNELQGWVVGGNGTLYATNNAGTSWSPLQSATNQDLNSIHTFDGINLWTVGNSGVISTNYSPATGIERLDLDLPSSFIVEQNFPNPFNPNTKIRFGITGESNVLVEVYNITGQKVAELINEKMSPGFYEVNFNAAQFSSGIYIYTVKTDMNSITRKMTLLK